MDAKRILGYLRQLSANNNRTWFQEHRDEYDTIRSDFEHGVEQAIRRIATFDSTIAHLTVKDCTYRFYRDTRFSPDKSPYKNHLGAYIAAHGKKALHGGYYIHLEPDHCMVACGNYWLPTNILTSCRNEMMSNTDEWLRCVESPEFIKYYGDPVEAPQLEAPQLGGSASAQQLLPQSGEAGRGLQGFGLERLKTCPAGFPRDWPHVGYLRLKDYCCWHCVDDSFYQGDQWLDDIEPMFRAAKPMMDMMNAVIDDYE